MYHLWMIYLSNMVIVQNYLSLQGTRLFNIVSLLLDYSETEMHAADFWSGITGVVKATLGHLLNKHRWNCGATIG